MTDPYEVSAHERGVVRVFTTDLDTESNAAITADKVSRLLGHGLDLDPTRVEVFPSSQLDPLGLSEYLREGYGIPADDLEGKASALDALKGLIILVASSAFKGQDAKLEPTDGIRFVGAFSEPGAEPPRQMGKSDDPPETLQPKGGIAEPPPGRKPGALTMLAVLLLAAALVLLLAF